MKTVKPPLIPKCERCRPDIRSKCQVRAKLLQNPRPPRQDPPKGYFTLKAKEDEETKAALAALRKAQEEPLPCPEYHLFANEVDRYAEALKNASPGDRHDIEYSIYFKTQERAVTLSTMGKNNQKPVRNRKPRKLGVLVTVLTEILLRTKNRDWETKKEFRDRILTKLEDRILPDGPIVDVTETAILCRDKKGKTTLIKKASLDKYIDRATHNLQSKK